MKKLSLIVAATLAVTTSAVLAATSPATATFQVLITVAKACSVVAGAGSKIDFGTVDSSATGLSGTSNISVTCSKTTPYNIGLLPSNNNTTGAGVMSPASGSDTVAYQLRSAAGTSGAVWGSTATSVAVGNGVAGTGTGAAQTIPVYATVASANVTPGAYSDTVTVQVNY